MSKTVCQKKSIITAYIEVLLEKENELSRRLGDVEELLNNQRKANQEMAECTPSPENVVGPKNPTITYPEQAAKRPVFTALKSEKDIRDLLRNRGNDPKIMHTVIIKPPAGVTDPVRYLARKYKPGSEGIKVKKRNQNQKRQGDFPCRHRVSRGSHKE